MKRILVIVAILVAAAAIVMVGVLLRDRAFVPEGPAGTLPPPGTLPIAQNNPGGEGTGGVPAGQNGNNAGMLPIGGVTAVAQTAVVDYAVNTQGVIFMAPNGSVILASTTETIARAELGDMLDARFSPNGRWLIAKSGNSNFASWNLLDVAQKTWRAIQADTQEMTWSGDSSQLAYLGFRTGGSALNVYSPQTNSTRTLLNLSAPDLMLRSKDGSRMLLMDKPSSLVGGTVWQFSPSGNTLTPFATNVAGVEFLWGGVKSGGLLFTAGPTGGNLNIVNAEGAITQSTTFLTLPSKCVFGESAATSTIQNISDYLICAIPQDQQDLQERQLPDDYLKGKFGTVDTLYAINLFSGVLTQLLPASQSFSFDAANLKVYGDSLYFVNRNDRKLYRVPLSALAPSPEVAD